MKVGTQVTYTQKGYATDFIVKINNKFVNPTLSTQEEVYTQRKGIITNIKKWASGSVMYTVKWEDVGGYWEDDESVVYREDIQEIEKEEEVEEKAPITTNNQPKEETMTTIEQLLSLWGKVRTSTKQKGEVAEIILHAQCYNEQIEITGSGYRYVQSVYSSTDGLVGVNFGQHHKMPPAQRAFLCKVANLFNVKLHQNLIEA